MVCRLIVCCEQIMDEYSSGLVVCQVVCNYGVRAACQKVAQKVGLIKWLLSFEKGGNHVVHVEHWFSSR